MSRFRRGAGVALREHAQDHVHRISGLLVVKQIIFDGLLLLVL
jgi:hypothetical protein